MKKIISIIIGLAVCCGWPAAAWAAADQPIGSSLDNFTPRASYQSGQFIDVDENAWYGAEQQGVVKTACELALMNGRGNGSFLPLGQIKICEAVKMAAVVHRIYHGLAGEMSVDCSLWYANYLDYAVENGIIDADDFAEYNAAATRADLAYIFARALPASELTAVNTVNSLIDVTDATLYREEIFTLYRAGVLTGDMGTRACRPGDTITRAEAAAMAARLVLPAARQHFEILPAQGDSALHAPEYAVYNEAGDCLALGYQPLSALAAFFHGEPERSETYGFLDGTDLIRADYAGDNRIFYLLADQPAGGIYLYQLMIRSPEYALANGLRCGSAAEEVPAAYGAGQLTFVSTEPFAGFDGAYSYYPGLSSPWCRSAFCIKDGLVAEIDLTCSVY